MDEFQITIAGDQVIVTTGGFTPEIHADADKLIAVLDKLFVRKETVKLKHEHQHLRKEEHQHLGGVS